jgi:hypothetical protein
VLFALKAFIVGGAAAIGSLVMVRFVVSVRSLRVRVAG